MATEIDSAGVMARAILDAADFRGARVLEIGTGDGRLTVQYSGVARSVVGIDINEADVWSASRRFDSDQRADVRFVCATATALPFSAERFEIVLLASSL